MYPFTSPPSTVELLQRWSVAGLGCSDRELYCRDAGLLAPQLPLLCRESHAHSATFLMAGFSHCCLYFVSDYLVVGVSSLTDCLITGVFSNSCVYPQADYCMAGSSDGLLFVWKRETGMKITQIQAHHSCIHYCTTLPNTGMDDREYMTSHQIILKPHTSSRKGLAGYNSTQTFCFLLDESQKNRDEELLVATSSDDGMVKLWQPLQVRSFLCCYP